MNDISQSIYLLNEIKNKKELSEEELKYLYEIDNHINIKSYKEELLLEDVKNNRDIKKDLSIIYGCKKEEVGVFNPLEDISNNIVIYYGNLNSSNIKDKKVLSKLKLVIGNVNFDKEEEIDYLSNLEIITGNANFRGLKSARDFENLKIIEGNANFSSLYNSNGLEKLEYIGGNANFPLLIDGRGFKNLKNIGGNAIFTSLFTTDGFERLENIGEDAYFPMLEYLNSSLNVEKDVILYNKRSKSKVLKK